MEIKKSSNKRQNESDMGQKDVSKSTYVQGLRVTFSNGMVGDFFGKAVIPKEELGNVTIANVELGEPEKFEEHIKESLLNKSSGQRG